MIRRNRQAHPSIGHTDAMIVADLHVHTTASDGWFTLSTLVKTAAAADIEAVAVTDHDLPHPDLKQPVTSMEGVTVIHGIELRVEADGTGRFDILGFGLSETPSLRHLVDDIQSDRTRRAAVMVDLVEDVTGVSIEVPIGPGVGRPHIARAIADHPDLNYSFQGAFDHLIGADGPCYVARSVPSYEHGVEVLRNACRLVGLAHPLRYRNPPAVIERTTDLDIIERWYPYRTDVDQSVVSRTIQTHDLLPTGGSDAHDDQLGRAGLSRPAFDRFCDRFNQATE